MDYVKVLEHQIVELEEVQEEVIKKITSKKENVTYTERALNVIANTSSKIQSIVTTLIAIQEENLRQINKDKKETAPKGQVQEQFKNISFKPDLTINGRIDYVPDFSKIQKHLQEEILLHLHRK